MSYMKNREGTVITFPTVDAEPGIGIFLTDTDNNNQWHIFEHESSMVIEGGGGMSVVVVAGELKPGSNVLIAVARKDDVTVNTFAYNLMSDSLEEGFKQLNDNMQHAIMRYLIPLADEDPNWQLYEDDVQDEMPSLEKDYQAEQAALSNILGGNS